MTDIFGHAERLPDSYTPSQAFDSLYSLLNVLERHHKGYMHDIAVALVNRAERLNDKQNAKERLDDN